MKRFFCVLVAAGLLTGNPALAANMQDLLNAREVEQGETKFPQAAGCQVYVVNVTTTDIIDGGTDETPAIRIFGSDGSTGTIYLKGSDGWQTIGDAGESAGNCAGPDGDRFTRVVADENNPGNNFEAGSTEKYFVFTSDVGVVSRIEIGLPDRAGTAASGWHLGKVAVRPAQPWNEETAFYYNDWIESRQMVSVGVKGGATDLSVSIRTGDASGAGTDANIRLTISAVALDGTPMTVFDEVVNPRISGNAFERNSVSSFTISGVTPAYYIDSITVTSDDRYAGSAWLLASVEISGMLCGGLAGQACTKDAPALFTINSWLQSGALSITKKHEFITPRTGSISKATTVREFLETSDFFVLLACANVDWVRIGTDVTKNTRCTVTAEPYGMDYLVCFLENDSKGTGKRQAVEECDRRFPAIAAKVGPILDAGAAPASVSGSGPDQPAPSPDPQASSGGSEEERCRTMVEGQVAWDQSGTTSWNPENIAALCAGATNAEDRIACFEQGIAAHDDWMRAITDCTSATADSADVSGSTPTDNAAPEAQSEPPASEPAQDPAAQPAEPVTQPAPSSICDELLADQCKALLQDQVPWTMANPDDPAMRRWAPENLDWLCTCTPDPAQTVQCFQDKLYELESTGTGDWTGAIETCRAAL